MSYNNPNDVELINGGYRGAVRRLDKCTGHDIYPGRGSIEGSPNVLFNGKPANRIGDLWKKHYGTPLIPDGDEPKAYYPAPYGPDGEATPYYNGNGTDPVTDDDIEYLGPPLNVGDPGYPDDLPPDPGPEPEGPPEPQGPTEPEPPPRPVRSDYDSTPSGNEAYNLDIQQWRKDTDAFREGPLSNWQDAMSEFREGPYSDWQEAVQEFKDSDEYKEWEAAAALGPPYHGDTIYPPMPEYPDPEDEHDSISSSGSANILINGLPLCRVADELECGSRMKFGSTNILVNGPIQHPNDSQGYELDQEDLDRVRDDADDDTINRDDVDDITDEIRDGTLGNDPEEP